MGRIAGFVSAAEFAELDESEYQECPVYDPKSTVLAVCYTSGSTGRPKGVEMTHYNYVASFYTTSFVLPFGEGDVVLGLNPITHQSGMLYTVIAMLDGGTIIITSASLNSMEIMDAVDKYKVVDLCTGQKLGPHQIGEICYHMASMALGYYKRPKETAELFDEEGWCKSGDAGYYDDDGHLYIVERLKQLIKCMGNQVVPGELEELLLREHSANIAEVTVVGLPHCEYGEAASAAVVLSQEGSKKNPELLAKSIKATVETHFAVYKHLHGGVFFLDSLPKTDNAKVNRPALARFLAAGLDTEKPTQV
ncbi:probable 4-coumarate--CoA ligase 1 isoform X2 [Dermacentor silvarum]|uniref:probable 4-coumarate--CoA ligase 1 isoform X2 n=1 Tax=Dermacentor silvarum TaxID=543639 RepID=UPI00210126E7|nr:probable 4-coumarate--CoA ligase 1 isoform X2 [Dermacentor silvarum]